MTLLLKQNKYLNKKVIVYHIILSSIKIKEAISPTEIKYIST